MFVYCAGDPTVKPTPAVPVRAAHATGLSMPATTTTWIFRHHHTTAMEGLAKYRFQFEEGWSRLMVRLNWHPRLVCMLIGGPVILTGCALRMPPYPVHPASSYANRVARDAVDVAIHPITKEAESRKYFGTNLVSRNVLAILVVVDNHSASSVVLDAAQCELVGLPDRADDDQLPGKTAGQATAVVSVATISLAGGVVAMKMMFDSENIKYNLHVKELGRQTVSPGKSAQGFLYFRLPDRHSSKEAQTRWHVKIAVSKLGAAATSYASLTFDWER